MNLELIYVALKEIVHAKTMDELEDAGRIIREVSDELKPTEHNLKALTIIRACYKARQERIEKCQPSQ